MSKVVFEHVEKRYFAADKPAVDDFSLEIADGEFAVLVGPSGCGKSTTLRMVAGLETPTSGRIHIGERDVTNVAPKDRDIAMVFQNYALYPHMNVWDNMAFALKLRKFPKSEIARRVSAAGEALGLTDYFKRLPKALSGGQRQRVALGRAIVREPSVFLFDEPLSNLDAKMRVEMRAEIVRLHKRLGATMIYVTHDQTEAMTMGQRIVVMNEGKICQVAPPMEIYNHPKTPFVGGFIGTPPMNIFGRGELGFEGMSGVRPENIAISEREKPHSLRARVEFLEPLGSETIVHLSLTDCGNKPIIAKCGGFSQLKVSQEVFLCIKEGSIIRF